MFLSSCDGFFVSSSFHFHIKIKKNKKGPFALYNILFFFPYLLNNKKFIIFHLPYILLFILSMYFMFQKSLQNSHKSAITVIFSVPPPSYRPAAAALPPSPLAPHCSRRPRAAAAPSSSLLPLLVHHW